MDDNLFAIRLTLLTSEMISELDSGRRSKDGFDPVRPLNQQENYLRSCFGAMGEVWTIILQLEQSAIFLANFRTTKTLKRNKISRFDHIVYHLEGYFFRVTGVLDRLLILVNRVLKLGLADINCKAFIMLIDDKGKKGKLAVNLQEIPGLFKALLDISIFMAQFREQRNAVAHSNRIEFGDLRTVEMYHIVLTDTDDPEILRRAFLFKQETDRKVLEYKAMLNKNTLDLKELIDKVYNLLKEPFELEYLSLSQDQTL